MEKMIYELTMKKVHIENTDKRINFRRAGNRLRTVSVNEHQFNSEDEENA